MGGLSGGVITRTTRAGGVLGVCSIEGRGGREAGEGERV